MDRLPSLLIDVYGKSLEKYFLNKTIEKSAKERKEIASECYIELSNVCAAYLS